MKMNKDLLRIALARWSTTVGEIHEIETTHEKPDGLVATTWFVTAQDGKQYVLKNVADRAEDQASIESEINVLRHLAKWDVPVAVPIATDDNNPYVEQNDGAYLLYPVLPADDSDSPNIEPKIVYTNIGRALARLHKALATYPGEIDSWSMNLPKTIAEDAAPEIERALVGQQLKPFQKTLAELAPDIENALAELPKQHIHGDCHGGNFLLYRGDVSGFIDLDHMPRGPRSYDIAYVMADFAKAPLFGGMVHENWMENFVYIIKGYEQIEQLSQKEKDALWILMLCIQLMFAYWLFKYQNEDVAQKNLQSFYWLHERKSEINEKLSKTDAETNNHE